jgi:hypothetical protein
LTAVEWGAGYLLLAAAGGLFPGRKNVVMRVEEGGRELVGRRRWVS